jgi:hypothetical protein
MRITSSFWVGVASASSVKSPCDRIVRPSTASSLCITTVSEVSRIAA